MTVKMVLNIGEANQEVFDNMSLEELTENWVGTNNGHDF